LEKEVGGREGVDAKERGGNKGEGPTELDVDGRVGSGVVELLTLS
jgi:hypothetical protein